MNEKVVSCEADIDQKYEMLTEKYEIVKSQLDKTMKEWVFRLISGGHPK